MYIWLFSNTIYNCFWNKYKSIFIFTLNGSFKNIARWWCLSALLNGIVLIFLDIGIIYCSPKLNTVCPNWFNDHFVRYNFFLSVSLVFQGQCTFWKLIPSFLFVKICVSHVRSKCMLRNLVEFGNMVSQLVQMFLQM